MPPKAQRRVTLSAGEDCTLSGSGAVIVTLLTGVIDIAGVPLEANHPYTFYLSEERRLILYTLGGGSASVSSEFSFEMHKGVTGVDSVAQLVIRSLVPQVRSKLLVIGKERVGKTLSAHTCVNLLIRHKADVEGGAKRKVFLIDLNAESNSLYSPGCVTAVHMYSSPLLLGSTADPSLLPLSLYTAGAVRPTAKEVGPFFHLVEQVHDTTLGYAADILFNDSSDGSYHVVIDAPSPQSDLKEGVFYKKLIEITRPTHVLLVASRDDQSDPWPTFLQEDVQRILPDCEFVFTPPVSRPSAGTPRADLLMEYFVGTPHVPLGCSKVVVPSHSLHFVEYTMDATNCLVARRAGAPIHTMQSLVCSVSHAEMLEEVALAPIAGLVVIAHVDEEHDEVVLIVPSSSEEPLQRRYIIVPGSSSADRESLRLTHSQIATIQESVVV